MVTVTYMRSNIDKQETQTLERTKNTEMVVHRRRRLLGRLLYSLLTGVFEADVVLRFVLDSGYSFAAMVHAVQVSE